MREYLLFRVFLHTHIHTYRYDIFLYKRLYSFFLIYLFLLLHNFISILSMCNYVKIYQKRDKVFLTFYHILIVQQQIVELDLSTYFSRIIIMHTVLDC